MGKRSLICTSSTATTLASDVYVHANDDDVVLTHDTLSASGISGRMFGMYRGELANASALRQQKLISMSTGLIWRVWLTIKFVVRLTQRPLRKPSN